MITIRILTAYQMEIPQCVTKNMARHFQSCISLRYSAVWQKFLSPLLSWEGHVFQWRATTIEEKWSEQALNLLVSNGPGENWSATLSSYIALKPTIIEENKSKTNLHTKIPKLGLNHFGVKVLPPIVRLEKCACSSHTNAVPQLCQHVTEHKKI